MEMDGGHDGSLLYPGSCFLRVEPAEQRASVPRCTAAGGLNGNITERAPFERAVIERIVIERAVRRFGSQAVIL